MTRGIPADSEGGERFIYLCAGKYAGQSNSPWARRIKVPLTGITGALVERALRDPATILEAQVPGTARDGGPYAATVKPFDGWKLQS